MCYGQSKCTNGLYFDRIARSQRIRHQDFIEVTLEDERDMPPIVPHNVVSIDADASGFGRCGFCLKLCPAERYVSPLSGFAHCDEECRGLAEDQLLNDMEALGQQRQLVLGFVDDELAELIAGNGMDDGDDDHDEVWKIDARQLALALEDAAAPISAAPTTQCAAE